MTIEPTVAAPELRPARSLRQHLSETARLAGPVVVSRSGALILIAVDTAMTGRAGARELAYLGLGIAPQVVLLVIGIGLLAGTAVLAAQADGAGVKHECGAIWRIAVVHAAALGVLAGLLCLLGGPFLRLIGQDPDLAAGGGRVMAMFAWGMPGVLMGIATSFFLEGIRRPKAAMVITLGANFVNAGLNWIFIFGNLGAPALGAEGAVLATSIVRWLIAAMLLAYVYLMPGGEAYGIRGAIAGARGLGRRLRRFGYPLGLAYGLETAAMMTMVLLSGYLGTTALASFQIAQNLIALVFMTALGIGTATAVRVGNAVGRGDRHGVAVAGWAGIAMVAAAMVAFAVVFLAAPEMLARIYTDDGDIIRLAAATIWVVGLVLVFDGIQGVDMGALRGAGDVWIPACLQLFSFWGIAVPSGALFAFALGRGAPGLMLGLLVGMTVAAVALSLRFLAISRREVLRL